MDGDHRTDTDAALSDLRAHLAAAAAAAAGDIERTAEADVRAELERAEADAAATTARAAELGRRRGTAAVAAAAHRAASRRRGEILAARREADERFRSAATAAVLHMADEPGYPAILDGLRATAIALLGPDTVVTEDPAGGLIAHTGGRLLDLRLATIAVRAIDRVATEPGEEQP